jgi:hypothetical protein
MSLIKFDIVLTSISVFNIYNLKEPIEIDNLK